ISRVNQPDAIGVRTGDVNRNTVQVFTPGYVPRAFFVYKQKLDDQGRPFSLAGNTNADLLQTFEDLNGDGVIDTKDRYRTQQAAPKFILGLTSNLTSGNAYLNFTLRSFIGNYAYNNVSAGLNNYANTFTSNGNYFSNTTPLLGNEVNFVGRQAFSSYYVQDASFVRMENITVGYNFPKLGGTDGRNLGLSFSVQNAFTLSPYKGLDPEVVDGLDNNFYPRARTFNVGLSLGF
ncbi:MAG TPA: SusC/RagA family protein, partial [Hymenobacter sp.]